MEPRAAALLIAKLWLLLPLIGLPVSLAMHRRGYPGFLARLWVWHLIIPLFLGAGYLGRWPFVILLMACDAAICWEMVRLEIAERRRGVVFGLALALSVPWLIRAALAEPGAWPIAVTLQLTGLLMAGFSLGLLLPRPRWAVVRMAALAVGFGAGLALWVGLQGQPGGIPLVFFAFSVVVVSDILGFVVGRLVPRWYLFPRLSPRKTLTGYLGGSLGAVGAGLLIAFALPEWSTGRIVMAGLVLALAGSTGDLMASALKRQHGVADFGRALGPMGGILDRADSLLVSGWAFYLLWTWWT